jgi:Tetratricopeptide repeat
MTARPAALTLSDLGDLHGACELHEQTVAGFRRVLGEDHFNTLAAMGNLALARRVLGDFDSARNLQEQVLAACRRLFGDDHPDTLISMSTSLSLDMTSVTCEEHGSSTNRPWLLAGSCLAMTTSPP